jgi:hypothetical protein
MTDLAYSIETSNSFHRPAEAGQRAPANLLVSPVASLQQTLSYSFGRRLLDGSAS